MQDQMFSTIRAGDLVVWAPCLGRVLDQVAVAVRHYPAGTRSRLGLLTNGCAHRISYDSVRGIHPGDDRGPRLNSLFWFSFWVVHRLTSAYPAFVGARLNTKNWQSFGGNPDRPEHVLSWVRRAIAHWQQKQGGEPCLLSNWKLNALFDVLIAEWALQHGRRPECVEHNNALALSEVMEAAGGIRSVLLDNGEQGYELMSIRICRQIVAKQPKQCFIPLYEPYVLGG